jgi:hypothetical protein
VIPESKDIDISFFSKNDMNMKFGTSKKHDGTSPLTIKSGNNDL